MRGLYCVLLAALAVTKTRLPAAQRPSIPGQAKPKDSFRYRVPVPICLLEPLEEPAAAITGARPVAQGLSHKLRR